MEQLKLENIIQLIKELKRKGMTAKEISEIPIYLGNDEELNGIHTAFFLEEIDAQNEDDEDFVELINDDSNNISVDGKAILIS